MPPLSKTSKKRRERKEKFDKICGWAGRVFMFVFSTVALLFSFLSGFSCEFFSFENVNANGDDLPWIGLVPPFDGSRAADIGLFAYRITDSIISGEETQNCVRYEEIFSHNNHANGMGNLWVTAQICAVAAVCCGGIAMIFILIDLVTPWLSCSWMIPIVFLFSAFGLQCCTFLIFLETTFCFQNESNHECQLEKGGYYSIVSVILYWTSSIILCNLPRSDEDYCLLKARRPFEEDKAPASSSLETNNNTNGGGATATTASATAATTAAAAGDAKSAKLEKEKNVSSSASAAATSTATSTSGVNAKPQSPKPQQPSSSSSSSSPSTSTSPPVSKPQSQKPEQQSSSPLPSSPQKPTEEETKNPTINVTVEIKESDIKKNLNEEKEKSSSPSPPPAVPVPDSKEEPSIDLERQAEI